MKNLFLLLLLTISISITTSMLAAENLAMLRSTGLVKVNGKSVPNSLALFSGDAIETGSNSTAVVTAEDCIVQIAPGSRMTLKDDGVEVSWGSFGIKTNSQRPGIVGEYMMAPFASADARFELTFHGKEVWISAIDNSILLRAGAFEQFMIPKGKTAIVSNPKDAKAEVRIASESAVQASKSSIGPKAMLGTIGATAAVVPLMAARTNASEWKP